MAQVLPPTIIYDSTNKGPTVTREECDEVRKTIARLRDTGEDGFGAITIPIGLLERLVHTIEKRDAERERRFLYGL